MPGDGLEHEAKTPVPIETELKIAVGSAPKQASEANASRLQGLYEKYWRRFEKWCRQRRLTSLPAAHDTVTLYIKDLSGSYGIPKVRRHVSAISLAHLLAGHESPGGTAEVRDMLAELRLRDEGLSGPQLMSVPALGHTALLNDLPRKAIQEYFKGQQIFEESGDALAIYLVIQGRVSLARTAQDGQKNVIGIFAVGQVFSSAAFLGLAAENESAEALDRTVLSVWSAAEMEEYLERNPKTAVALMRALTRPYLDCAERLQNIARRKISYRLAWALLRLAQLPGNQLLENGGVRIPPLTHELISEYVGTARSMVTTNMNRLRQQGLIRYSQAHIDVHCEALREYLRQCDSVRQDSPEDDETETMEQGQLPK